MRVLLYGMQSSGASILAYTLAQKAGCVALVDLWNTFAAPRLKPEDQDVVVKAVVTTAYSLETHRRHFRPDVTLLVLRHPVDNYHSLCDKPYANENGLLDEKFALWEEVFRSGSAAGKVFDDVVHYEDFAFCPADVVEQFERMGWDAGPDALSFARTPEDIEATNIEVCPGLHSQVSYGIGNIRAGKVLRDRVRFSTPWSRTAHLPALCPALFDHYAAMRKAREAWHMPSRAVLSCRLHAILRELTGQEAIPQKAERLGYALQFDGGTPSCRIEDTEVILHPAPRQGVTRLTISGLPGKPFDRICGTVFAEHPKAMGTVVVLHVESSDGESVAEQVFTLSQSSMRQIDLKFHNKADTIRLSISVRVADTAVSEKYSGVCLRELRLEQASD